MTVKQSSGAQTTISGKAPTVSVEASSGSSFDGYELDSEHCEARASSGASVQVTVQKDLNASASSGGQIHYRGNGMISSVAAHSGGEVNKN